MTNARRFDHLVIRPDHDPAGRPCVVVQLPDSWITLLPPDARRFAAALIDAADEAEQ